MLRTASRGHAPPTTAEAVQHSPRLRPRAGRAAGCGTRWSGGWRSAAAGALLAAGGDGPSRAHLRSEGGGARGCQGAGRGVTRRRGGQSQGQFIRAAVRVRA